MPSDKNIVDEEDALAQRGGDRGLPLNWRAGGQQVGPTQRLVKTPTKRELAVFSRRQVRTCGMCKHFRGKYFQQVRDSFMAKLVAEYEWNPDYIGDKPQNMGRCMQDDELVVGPNSLGCEVFRAK